MRGSRGVLRQTLLAFAFVFTALACCPAVFASESEKAFRLSPSDERKLAGTLAEECPDALYAARVGMAAAVLGRMRAPGYPDDLAGVLAGLRAEGAFGQPQEPQQSRPGPLCALLPGLRRFVSRVAGLPDPGDSGRLHELSLHAVRAAEAGADPAGGALDFRVVRAEHARDLLFNDSAEDARRQAVEAELRGYPLAIGEVGFR